MKDRLCRFSRRKEEIYISYAFEKIFIVDGDDEKYPKDYRTETVRKY